MLVLSRRVGEKIILPGLNVTVQVIAVKGRVIRLGIEAPRPVTVLRAELHRQGVSPLENQQATGEHPAADRMTQLKPAPQQPPDSPSASTPVATSQKVQAARADGGLPSLERTSATRERVVEG